MLVQVNGEDLHNVSHVEARTVLSRSSRLMRFTLLREKAADSLESPLQELGSTKKIAVSLLKPPSEQLGIKVGYRNFLCLIVRVLSRLLATSAKT